MKLRIFVPLITADIHMPECVAFLYPFYNTAKSADEKINQFGNWFLDVEITQDVEFCHVILLPYNIAYYYKHKQTAFLKNINNQSIKFDKLIICATKGDLEVTPKLNKFHLYRMGGYASKNKGNQFTYPVFIKDPLTHAYNSTLTYHETKTEKPIIGFCGQAKGSLQKWLVDIGRGTYRRILKLLNKWPYDNEVLESSTIVRAKILDLLEQSPLVQANFIRHAKYRGGVKTKEDKEENTRLFFNNMKQSQYIICYRGAGNYSVRLYETMASGRIPIIVKSNNSLPFSNEINWNIFPMVEQKNINNIAQYIASFHAAMSEGQFILLQKEARRIWEQYLSYKSFMDRWLHKYVLLFKP